MIYHTCFERLFKNQLDIIVFGRQQQTGNRIRLQFIYIIILSIGKCDPIHFMCEIDFYNIVIQHIDIIHTRLQYIRFINRIQHTGCSSSFIMTFLPILTSGAWMQRVNLFQSPATFSLVGISIPTNVESHRRNNIVIIIQQHHIGTTVRNLET